MYKRSVALSKGCYYKVLKYLEIKHELFKIKQNQIFPFCSTHENYQNTLIARFQCFLSTCVKYVIGVLKKLGSFGFGVVQQ